MSTSYDLVSIQLATIFDQRKPSLPLPVVVDQTIRDGLALIDGATRAPHRLARVVRPAALLGLSIGERPAETLTVAVDIRVDKLSTVMWHQHTEGLRASLKAATKVDEEKDEEPDLPDVAGRHRLLVVTAQGKTVGAVVIGLRPSDGEAVRQRVTFQVQPEQIGDDGLLMIGVDWSDADRAWDRGAAMADGTVGVAIGRVHLTPGAGEIPPTVAVGRGDDQGALVTGETGFLVLNPGTPDVPCTLELTVRGLSGERLRGRRARVKHPARAVKEYAQDRRLDVAGDIAVEVRDLAGELVSGPRLDGNRLHLPAGIGPVLVRPVKLGPSGQPVEVDWAVRVD